MSEQNHRSVLTSAAPVAIPAQRRPPPRRGCGRPSIFAGGWCSEHEQETRTVGRPGSADEQERCSRCEAAFIGALDALLAGGW